MNALLEETNEVNHCIGSVDFDCPKKVLIVDESEETRDVLAMALERKGVRAFTTAILRRGATIARKEKPDLVIIDIDSVSLPPAEALDLFIKNGNISEVPVMTIGSGKFVAPAGEVDFISKPYHFLPLIERIEEFLGGGNKEM